MPCCKGAQYKHWCNTVPIVPYKDSDGNQYCLFHAPVGEKNSSAADFNKMVIDRASVFKIINSGAGGECNFAGAIFPWDINFKQEFSILRTANFSDARFEGVVDFSDINFMCPAVFTKATFVSDANFTRSTFSEDANYFGATFGKNFYCLYANFNKNTRFTEANFKEIASFSNATFDRRAEFHINYFKEANFLNSNFKSGASFFKVTFDQAFFISTNFQGRTEFKEIVFHIFGQLTSMHISESIKMESAILENVSFLNTDLRKIDFDNCTWPKKEGRNVLFDELKLAEKNAPIKDINKVESLYRKLKQKFKEEHNEAEVSNWHYAEKEMQRKKTPIKNVMTYSFLHLYYISSGYSEEPRRGLLALILLICIAAFILSVLGLTPTTDKMPYDVKSIQWPRSMDIELLFVNIFKYVTYQREYALVPMSKCGDFAKSAFQILISIQAALFALAVRNKFRR